MPVESKVKQLPDCRPERVTETLQALWASSDPDFPKVAEELRHLFREQFAEESRKEQAAR